MLSARTEGRYQEPAIVAALQAIDAEETALRAQFPARSSRASVRRPGQNGRSGSIAIATNSSVRYVIDAWKTRMGRGSVPRTARL